MIPVPEYKKKSTIQSEEALPGFGDKEQGGTPRAHVMSAYQESHKPFGSLYRKLAEWPLRETSTE
jgi:hypothetical protein